MHLKASRSWARHIGLGMSNKLPADELQLFQRLPATGIQAVSTDFLSSAEILRLTAEWCSMSVCL